MKLVSLSRSLFSALKFVLLSAFLDFWHSPVLYAMLKTGIHWGHKSASQLIQYLTRQKKDQKIYDDDNDVVFSSLALCCRLHEAEERAKDLPRRRRLQLSDLVLPG